MRAEQDAAKREKIKADAEKLQADQSVAIGDAVASLISKNLEKVKVAYLKAVALGVPTDSPALRDVLEFITKETYFNPRSMHIAKTTLNPVVVITRNSCN